MDQSCCSYPRYRPDLDALLLSYRQLAMLSWTYVGFTILFALMVICNLVGNTLVILVVTLNRSMRTPTNYLLVNLASADMVVAVFIGLQFIATPTFTHPQGTLGSVLCKIITGGNPGWVGAVASVFSLVAIAIERYWAVLHPHSQKIKLTKKKILILALLSWIVSIIWAIPGFWATTYIKEIKGCAHSFSKPIYAKLYTVGWSVVAGVIPITIMGRLYSKVVYRLWFANSTNAESSQRALLRYRKRVTKMVIFVTVVYVMCWVPELLIYFLGFTGAISLQAIHHVIASALVVFNSSINPAVYSLQSSKFRKHIGDMICCKKNIIIPLNDRYLTHEAERSDGEGENGQEMLPSHSASAANHYHK